MSQGGPERLLLLRTQNLVHKVPLGHLLVAICAVGLIVLAVDYTRMLMLRRKMVYSPRSQTLSGLLTLHVQATRPSPLAHSRKYLPAPGY